MCLAGRILHCLRAGFQERVKKGLNPYAIAKGIERKGTKAHPFMYPAVDRSIEAVKDIFSKVIDYILSL